MIAHQASLFGWSNSDQIDQVHSLMPVLVLCMDTMHSPIYWSNISAQNFVQVGMAAMLAGVCQVPLTSVLLLFELTRDYRIILPLMGAVGLSSWIASSSTKKNKRAKNDLTLSPGSSLVSVLQTSQSSQIPNVTGLAAVSTSDLKSSSGNQDDNGSLQNVTEKFQEASRKDGSRDYESPAEVLKPDENDLCNIDASLCLANLEISEEQLAEEIPVMMAMRTRFASVSMTTTVRDAMSVMVEEKEWCVLLLDSNQQLLGLLTLADIQQAAGVATSIGFQTEVFFYLVSLL